MKNWVYYEAAEKVLLLHGFVVLTEGTNGSGSATFYDERPLSKASLEALNKALTECGFTRRSPYTWEAVDQNVEVDLVPSPNGYVPRMLIITHPQDGKWVDKIRKYYDEYKTFKNTKGA